MHDSIGVLVFSLLQVSLDLFRVERLEAIWLKLESFIEILQKLNVILYSLRPLLFNGQIGFITECLRSNTLAVKILIGGKCHCLVLKSQRLRFGC